MSTCFCCSSAYYTGESLDWQLGRGSIYNKSYNKKQYWYFRLGFIVNPQWESMCFYNREGSLLIPSYYHMTIYQSHFFQVCDTMTTILFTRSLLVKGFVVGVLETVSKRPGKKTEQIRNQRNNRDHPDQFEYSLLTTSGGRHQWYALLGSKGRFRSFNIILPSPN